MYKDFLSIIIHDGPKLEITKMPINGFKDRMDKHIVI